MKVQGPGDDTILIHMSIFLSLCRPLSLIHFYN